VPVDVWMPELIFINQTILGRVDSNYLQCLLVLLLQQVLSLNLDLQVNVPEQIVHGYES